MSQLPKIVRGRLAGAPIAQSHPDPDLLTAFVEGGLGARERDQLVSHLGACAECRDVVALATTPESLATPDLQFAAARSTPKWWDMSALRWATVSATAVIVLAAALLVRPVHKTEAPYLTGSNIATDERAATSLQKSDEHGTTHATLVAPAAPPPNRKAEPAARALDLESAYSSRDKLEAKQSPKPRMISPNTSAEIVQEAPAVPALRSDVVTKAKPAAAPAAENIAQSGPAVSGQVASGLAGGVAGGIVAAAPQTDSTRAAAAPSRISPLASNIARSNEENQLQSRVASSANQVPAYASPTKSAMAKKATAARQSAEKDGATGPEAASGAAKISTATVASAGARPPAEVMSTPTSIAKDKLPPLRWTIDRGGNLQRSADGKTWDVVPFPNGTKLHSLAVLENELWAGGAGGALYHSSDGGTQWVRVHPAAGEAELSGDITRITLADPQHITLTTSSSEQWTSADGGRTWQRR